MKKKVLDLKTLSIKTIFLLLISMGISCKKDFSSDVTANSKTSSTRRLSLTKSDFDNLYKNLRKASNKQSFKDFVNLKNQTPDFVSLAVSGSDDKMSQTAIRISENNLIQKNQNQNIGKHSATKGKLSVYGGEPEVPNTDPPTYDEVVEELVDDQSFATLLNDDGEIQVDDIIYKVTPFGTFFATASNILALENVFDNVYLQNDYTLRLYDPTTPVELNNLSVTGTSYNDVKLINQAVYFIDSFVDEAPVNPVEVAYEDLDTTYPVMFPAPTTTPTQPNAAPQTLPLERQQTNIFASARPTRPSIDQTPLDPYTDMKEYEMDFRSGVGSIVQTLFENSTRYYNFNSQYRISTLLYNRNYGVLKSLGIKVKFQTKGWLWWNKTNTSEIRAGWDYIAYKSAITVPKISLPSNDLPPSIGAPYLINPTENPYYAMPMYGSNDAYAKRYNLYGWNINRGNNNLFTIMLPGGMVPFKPHGFEVPAGAYKEAIKLGWSEMKKILRKSAPPSVPAIVNSDPDNFKFPVYSLTTTGSIHYLSINDMESMPKSYNTSIMADEVMSLNDYKIHTFVSPYESVSYNDDKIDIPLDFSTINIKISTDPSNIALSGVQIAKSLATKELATSFDVQGASIFGAVKYNNQWKGIRLKVKLKD